jgi:hypothetical protein
MHNTAQVLMREWSVEQFKHFASRCETLRLHALAAHAFRKLIILDPDNSQHYREYFRSNMRKAGHNSLSLFSSDLIN